MATTQKGPGNEVAVPQTSVMHRIVTATTPAERAKLQGEALERVYDERFEKEIPRFLTELPFGGSPEEITERMASAILVAEDPDAAQAEQSTSSSQHLVGKKVVIYDLRTMASDKPKGYGVFLILDATIGDDEVHQVVSTGAAQAVARLARAYAEDGLPITGAFSEIPGTGKQGSPALTFIVEKAF